MLLFQEYDFEIVVNPGCLNVEPNHLSCIETGEEPNNLEDGLPDAQLFAIKVFDENFLDIIQFLTTGWAPDEYTVQQKKEPVSHATNFTIIVIQLCKLGENEVLHRYVLEYERLTILDEAHGGIARGHYNGKETTKNIFRAGFWWPTLHSDVVAHYRACDVCQRTGNPSRRDEMTLHPQMAL